MFSFQWIIRILRTVNRRFKLLIIVIIFDRMENVVGKGKKNTGTSFQKVFSSELSKTSHREVKVEAISISTLC